MVQEGGEGQIYPQQVLPDKMASVVFSSQLVGWSLSSAVLQHQWNALEARDFKGIPGINILYSELPEKKAQRTTRQMIGRIRYITRMCGVLEHELRGITIILDPTEEPLKSDARAFYSHDSSVLWVKKMDRDDFDHEIIHWITLSVQKQDTQDMPKIVKEGVAWWLAYEVSRDPEKAVRYGNYESHLRGIIESGFNIDILTADWDGAEPVSHWLGGELFKTISEELGGDTKKVMRAWRDYYTYSNARDWLASIGKGDIEQKWKQRLRKLGAV